MQQNKIKPPFLIASFKNFPLQKKMLQTKEGFQNWVNYLLRKSYMTDVKIFGAPEKDKKIFTLLLLREVDFCFVDI